MHGTSRDPTAYTWSGTKAFFPHGNRFRLHSAAPTYTHPRDVVWLEDDRPASQGLVSCQKDGRRNAESKHVGSRKLAPRLSSCFGSVFKQAVEE